MIRYRYSTKRPSQLPMAVSALQVDGWEVTTRTNPAGASLTVTSDRDPGEVEGAVLAVLPDASPEGATPV